MKISKKLFLLMSSFIILGGFLSACNTVEGAGQDLQAGGHAISTAASDAS